MRVLFSSTWGYGHVFPLVPLAQALVASGHDVLWATNEQAGPTVAAAGIDVVAAGLDNDGVTQARQQMMAGATGIPPQQRAAHAFPTMFAGSAAPAMARDLLPIAREWQPDLMVHEPAELASSLVGAVLGVPSLTQSFGGAVPAPILTAAGERLRTMWTGHGLPLPPYAGQFLAPYLDICPPAVQTVPVDHVDVRQPLRPITWTGPAGSPLPTGVTDVDPRPLVYVTLGTVSNASPVLSAAVAGAARTGARVLVTVGPDGDPAALGPQPGHVTVERWVDQATVLTHCSVVVSHAGSGTFLGALALGLPQLCLPQAADQFRNTEGVERSGAGIGITPDQMTPEAVGAAVARLLADDAYRSAAEAVAADIAAMPSPAEVVPVLERLEHRSG